jgi:HEAT repeat protein
VRDVRLGLDILTVAQHPDLHARLEQLTIDERATVRTDALERLRDVAPNLAATAARSGVDDPSPEVRAASVRVIGAARDVADVDAVLTHVTDPSREVRLAVAYALTRLGDRDGCALLNADIGRLSTSARPGRPRPRRLAARRVPAGVAGRPLRAARPPRPTVTPTW